MMGTTAKDLPELGGRRCNFTAEYDMALLLIRAQVDSYTHACNLSSLEVVTQP